MLQKLSIMLLSSAKKITYYAFENCPLFPASCNLTCECGITLPFGPLIPLTQHYGFLILSVAYDYCSIRVFDCSIRESQSVFLV